MSNLSFATLFCFCLNISISFAASAEKLEADSSFGQRLEGLIQYQGNVRFSNADLRLHADKLTTRKPTNSSAREITASGSPVKIHQSAPDYKLDAQSNYLQYFPEKKQLLTKEKVHILLDQIGQGTFDINASIVEYQFTSEQKKSLLLEAIGSPITFEILDSDNNKVSGKAEQLNYSSVTGELILESNIEFKQLDETFKADKLIYNVAKKEWRIPAVKDKRIEVIKKTTHE